MPGASELLKRRVPEPVVEGLRRLRHVVAAAVTGGELARLRAEFSEQIDARTRDLLARSDEVLSSYDRRVAAVATRLLDLEERVAAGAPGAPDADSVVAAHVEVAPQLLDHQLAADLALAGRPDPARERERLASYIAVLGKHPPVLDLGCGRGDLLAVMHEHGIEATGVDPNPVLVAAAHQSGLDAVAQDLFVHLAARPEASVAAVTAVGLLEHLSVADAARLLRSVARVVSPGGMVLVETPDPSSVDGRDTLWQDVLCERLYNPAMLGLLCRDAGLDVDGVEAAPSEAGQDPGRAGVGRYTLIAHRR